MKHVSFHWTTVTETRNSQQRWQGFQSSDDVEEWILVFNSICDSDLGLHYFINLSWSFTEVELRIMGRIIAKSHTELTPKVVSFQILVTSLLCHCHFWIGVALSPGGLGSVVLMVWGSGQPSIIKTTWRYLGCHAKMEIKSWGLYMTTWAPPHQLFSLTLSQG